MKLYAKPPYWVTDLNDHEILTEYRERAGRLMTARMKGWNMPISTEIFEHIRDEIIRRGLEVPES